MARFYRLQLDTIYFTSDGTSGGLPCRLELDGVDGLLGDVIVTNVARQNDGSVKLGTLTSYKKGVELVANLVGSIKDTTFNSINSAIQDALESGLTMTLVGTGKPVNFSVEVVALPPTAPEFSGDRIKNASFSFITV